MAKLYPSTHILFAIRNKGIPTVTAISELAANSFRTGDKFWFTFLPDRVIAVDNGEGLSDMDAIFGLGYSQSRYVPGDIGEFGVGSKDAQMHFGSHCKVQSVHKGRYYEHSIDWDEVERSEEWPDTFSGNSRPTNFAPASIRDGGTMLTITNLVHRRINMEMLVKRLTHKFRPGLLKGCEITITDNRNGKPIVYKLDASLAAIGIEGSTTVKGDVAGRKFTLTYSMLKGYDQQLTGTHFGFDKQFILSTQYLCRTALPSRLYAEVMLSSDWKGCFSPNKEKIVKHGFELETAVFKLLEEWIKKLSLHAEQVHIEHVNLALAAEFENIIVLDRTKQGDQAEDRSVKTSEHGKGQKPVKPNPHKDEKTGKPGGDGACQNRKTRRGGISFSRNDGLGDTVAARATFDEANRSLRVELNGTVPMIDLAYQNPYKPVALWPVIAREFGKFCKERAETLESILPGFIDNLNKLGYGLETDQPELLADRIFTYIMKQCPLTVAERKKLGKVKLAENDVDMAEGSAS